MRLILFSLLLLSASLSFAQENYLGAIAKLKQQFTIPYQSAPARGKDMATSAYRMAFSFGSANPTNNVGNILLSYDLQTEAVQEMVDYQTKNIEPMLPEKIDNDLKTNLALVFVQQGMAWNCRHCETADERATFRKATADFMNLYDIEGAGKASRRSKKKFSGLPFFTEIMKRFADPEFQNNVINFYTELQQVVVSMADKAQLKTNVFELALKACNGDRQKAIELAGILISRDTNVIKYFDYVSTTNLKFIEATSMSPLLIRLIVEVDRSVNNYRYDRFSYDGKFEAYDVRNYYFWSGAYTTLKLSEMGYSDKTLLELNTNFPRFYKILRYIEELSGRALQLFKGKGWKAIDNEAFWRDTITVMKNSAEGSRFVSPSSVGQIKCEGLFAK